MNVQVLPKNCLVQGSNNRPMATDFFVNKSMKNKQPTVIFCHGYKGFKDWGCWNLVAEQFAQAGINFVKFNFSHNGVSVDNPLDFVDLEAFGNNNYSKELADLESIIDWVMDSNNPYHEFVDTNEIYLIGHSRGGGIVSLTAAKDTRIKKGVTWASVYDLTQRLPENTEEWKEKGVVYQRNGRTNQDMPLFVQFYENTELNKELLSIEKQGKNIRIPFCIIHGREDKAVSHTEAELLDAVIPTSEVIFIENAGHTFGSSHPWNLNELPQDLLKVVVETSQFLLP